MPVTRFTFLGSLKKLGKSYLLGGFIYTPTGLLGFPGSSAIKESACNAKDPGLIPGLCSSPGEGIGYPLQYSWASLEAQMVNKPLAMWKTWV